MTVSELITFLQTQPQDACVECLAERRGYGGYELYTLFEEMDLDDIDVIDLRGNPHVEPNNPNFNRVFVQIGNKD